MSETGLQPAPFWEQCVHELKIRHSRFRLRRHAASPYIYVREMDGGRKEKEFSLQPKRWCDRDDIEEARDLCIRGPEGQQAQVVGTADGVRIELPFNQQSILLSGLSLQQWNSQALTLWAG